MTLLFNTTLTVSVVLLAALGGTVLARRRSAALRHWILATAVACAMALPLLQMVVPSWHLGVPLPAFAPEAQTSTAAVDGATFRALGANAPTAKPVDAASPPFSIGSVIVSVWAAGVALSLSVLLIAMARLTRIASRATAVTEPRWLEAVESVAREHGLRRRVLLLQSDHPTLLVTWGLRQAKVILPAVARDWTDDRVRVVVCHEMAHIARWDWASQLLGEVLRSIHWFNPIPWLACRRLRRESEHACDDAVLNFGIEGPEYASHLLDVARALRHRGRWLPVPAMASPSNLERRIRAMLNARHNRQGITRSTRLLTSIAFLAATILVAGFGASAQTFATVAGTIVDSQGASLSDARLVLNNVETKAKYEVRSNRAGQFEFQGVTAGDYQLQAIAPGFKTFQTNVNLSGQALHRDVSMSVGTLEETINVSGGGGERSAADRLKDDQFAERARVGFQRTLAECLASDPVAGTSVGGKIRPPRKIRDVRPIYPDGARSAGLGGVARLVATIGTDGLVKDVKSVDAAVSPDLVQAATDAVRQWEFDGTLLNCVPVEVEMTVSVGFDPAR